MRLYQRIHIVRQLDDRKRGPHVEDASDAVNAYIKVAMDGGTLDIIYKRGNKSWKHTLFIDPPISGEIATPASGGGSGSGTPSGRVISRRRDSSPSPAAARARPSIRRCPCRPRGTRKGIELVFLAWRARLPSESGTG